MYTRLFNTFTIYGTLHVPRYRVSLTLYYYMFVFVLCILGELYYIRKGDSLPGEKLLLPCALTMYVLCKLLGICAFVVSVYICVRKGYLPRGCM